MAIFKVREEAMAATEGLNLRQEDNKEIVALYGLLWIGPFNRGNGGHASDEADYKSVATGNQCDWYDDELEEITGEQSE